MATVLRLIGVALVIVLLVPIIILAVVSAVSRKPTNLGVTEGKLAPCPPSPNCVSTQADDATHRMEPIPLRESADEAMKHIKDIVSAMPRATIVTEQPDYLHVEFRSRLFRFVDDVEFYIDEDRKQIHFRSASRSGYGDMGVNRARMEEIRQALEKLEP